MKKKIKEVLMKGFVLLTLSGIFVFKDSIYTNTDISIVYAASDLSKIKEDTIEKLKEVYRKYAKGYYTADDYKILKEYYKEGKKEINRSSSTSVIKSLYEKYKKLLLSVKPAKLVPYQQKMEKELLATYENLTKNNTYSAENLKRLKNLKKEGSQAIYGSGTKKLSQIRKDTYLYRLNHVENLIEETKNAIIDFISSSNSLTKKQKNKVIKNISKLDNLEEVKAIGDTYGYVKAEKEYITTAQIDKRIRELLKKYPKYSEEEIRILVATANMDYVKDEDIFTIFKVNSNEELEEKKEKLDRILSECRALSIIKYNLVMFPDYDGDYSIYKRTFKQMIKINDCYIDKKMKTHADNIIGMVDNIILKSTVSEEGGAASKGHDATIQLTFYFYDYDFGQYLGNHYRYDRDKVMSINDERLSGGAGYLLNRYSTETWFFLKDIYYTSFLHNNDLVPTDKIDEIIERYDGFITKRTKND